MEAENSTANLKFGHGGPVARRSRSGVKWVVALLVIVVLLGIRQARAPIDVEVLTVASAYPYLGATVLNATGYVVAQRKASVGSKANGRLVWLGVREGSKVKAGEILARLESADVEAQAGQPQPSSIGRRSRSYCALRTRIAPVEVK